jgi:hypothetical protein
LILEPPKNGFSLNLPYDKNQQSKMNIENPDVKAKPQLKKKKLKKNKINVFLTSLKNQFLR